MHVDNTYLHVRRVATMALTCITVFWLCTRDIISLTGKIQKFTYCLITKHVTLAQSNNCLFYILYRCILSPIHASYTYSGEQCEIKTLTKTFIIIIAGCTGGVVVIVLVVVIVVLAVKLKRNEKIKKKR